MKESDKRNEGARKRWAKPGFKDKMSQKMTEVLARPEVKANHSQAMRQLWEDPVYINAQRRSYEGRSDPEHRAKLSEARRLDWQRRREKAAGAE